MKNTVKFIALAIMLYVASDVFAQEDMQYNKHFNSDSAKYEQRNQVKNPRSTNHNDSMQMNKNNQRNYSSPNYQHGADSIDYNRKRVPDKNTPQTQPDSIPH